jgi:hypothetical protein
MTVLIALWSLFLLAVWIPHYLTWPWCSDHEHFAMMARSWEAGLKPYRDLFSYQFPGEIYLFWMLGKVAGWGNTVALYALDVVLFVGLGILLLLWGWRLSGRLLPGLIGFSSLLMYYLSLQFEMVAQRDFHIAVLALTSLTMPTIWPGHGGRFVSALTFGLALVFRPQVVVLLPAILWSVGCSARPPCTSWRQTLISFLAWGLISGLTVAIGFLPLALNGILDDFLNNLQTMRRLYSYGEHSTRTGLLNILAAARPLTLPKNLLLTTAIVVGLRLWDRPGNSTTRYFPIVLATIVGIAFYHAISPVQLHYHAVPQTVVAALGLTFASAQLSLGETRPLVRLVALGVLFLVFGARQKPLALEVLTPGDRTYGLGESLRILKTGELPLRPALGFYEHSGFDWSDARAVILYLREQVPPDVPIAMLMMENCAATGAAAGRTSAVPVAEGHGLYLWDYPSLIARVVAALETTESCLVVWNPTHPIYQAPRFQPLREVIGDRFEPEARFGNIEIWHLRPLRTDRAKAAKAVSRPPPISSRDKSAERPWRWTESRVGHAGSSARPMGGATARE